MVEKQDSLGQDTIDGKYILIKQIGEGGYADVFKAKCI